MLVKRHSENLQTFGDYSFPDTLKSWHQHVRIAEGNTETSLLKHIGKAKEDIIEESKQWPLQIATIKEEKGRLHLFLCRPKAITHGLTESIINITMLTENLHKNSVQVLCDQNSEENKDLTSLRLKYLTKAVKNMYEACKSATTGSTKILVTSKSSNKASEDTGVVLCGTVLNAKTGTKETTIDGNEYIRYEHNYSILKFL